MRRRYACPTANGLRITDLLPGRRGAPRAVKRPGSKALQRKPERASAHFSVSPATQTGGQSRRAALAGGGGHSAKAPEQTDEAMTNLFTNAAIRSASMAGRLNNFRRRAVAFRKPPGITLQRRACGLFHNLAGY